MPVGLAPAEYFNPLPPCGGRQDFQLYGDVKLIFQSTPSVWRETSHEVVSSDIK